MAPPAPMVIDLESPQQGTTSLPTSSALVSRPAGESRPVAPFPNMDFDFVASPEVPPAKVPTPVMKTKDAKKNSPRPSALQVAAMVGRPSSAPARKETKAPPPQAQAPRSAASTPQPPPISVPVARQTAKPPVPIAATAAATGAGNLFTSMAFSVELPTTEAANPLPTAAQNTGQLANELATKGSLRIDLTDLRGPGDISGLSLKGVDGLSNMDQEIPGENGREGGHDVANIDSRIDGLFGLGSTDLGGMNIDFDLGGDDGGGKTQFDDFFLADSKDHGGGGGFEF